MHYDGMIYRPPFEAASLLLQVTSGCSHNKCSFCTMYLNTPFRVSPKSEILEDLEEMDPYKWQISRVFLEGGDAFALSAAQLEEIAEMIHEHLPYVSTIAMYASINNIRTKTDDELARLHELGINDLNIGLESGDDEALAYHNKGYDAEEAEYQLQRLNKAGIRFGINVIFGASGHGRTAEPAEKTAALLNRVQPYLIFTGTLHYGPGSQLFEDIRHGNFIECTAGEFLEEEKKFVELLEMEDCRYFGLHPSNIIQMDAQMPRDKAEMLQAIEAREKEIPQAALDSRVKRGAEGAAILQTGEE